MKKKIIITEAQYNKLQEFLFETTDVNHTLDFVKVGDVLKFKTSAGSDYTINIKHVDHNSNEILGDNHGNKIRLSFDSYDEQNKKLNYNQLDVNTQKYLPKTADVHELDIERGGKVLPIPDIGGNKQPTLDTTAKPDDISKPVELDPNISGPTASGDTSSDSAEEEEKVKKERMYGKKALKAITSDPQLQAAFYRQPSFMKLFMADLQGKTAPGKGIQPTLALIGGYLDKKNKESNPDLASFKMGKIADLTISKPITFNVKSKILGGKDDTYTIPASKLSATNIQGNWYDATSSNYQNANMLQYSDKNKSLGFQFKIMVKPPAISKDTFKCDIVYGSDVVAKNVVITFLNSTGYNKNNTK